MRKQCIPGPFSSSSKGLGTRLSIIDVQFMYWIINVSCVCTHYGSVCVCVCVCLFKFGKRGGVTFIRCLLSVGCRLFNL